MKLPIRVIRRDFQEERFLDEETVYEIAQAILRGDPIPPITVCHDGENYWLQDGFHRVAAALWLASLVRSLSHQDIEIEAEIIPGTLADIESEFQRMPKRIAEFLALPSQELRASR